MKVILEFQSEKEFEQYKENIRLAEHSKKMDTISDIIMWCIENKNDVYLLQYYSQIGGDTVEEYFESLDKLNEPNEPNPEPL
jgi:hypothetical protein